mmetsp:Transcript_72137/g.88486  ORF Transcript_72137/g.88486 Transcript_72137/m.88486 type:complete len:281 (+) Transcript_72137:214-1056(+)
MVIHKHSVYEVKHIQTHQVLILRGDKLGPRFSGMPAEDMVKVWVQFLVVLVQISEQAISSQHASNLDQLIIVVLAMEKGLFSKDHASKHAAQTPNIQGVIVQLQIYQKLGTLVVSRCHTNIVLSTRVVKLCKPPVDESQLPILMINHHIVRLHISVHDSLRMAIVQSLENLKDVVPNVMVRQRRVELLEVRVVDVLKDQAWGLGLRIPHYVQELHDIRAAVKVLQNPDFTFDLLFLYWLQYLDDTFLLRSHVNSFKHLTVFASANFAEYFVVVLTPPVHR